jgi:hypothetical protein
MESAMKQNVYIVLLEGGGDVFVKVVDEETFNWITSDDPGFPPDYKNESSWIDQLVPASQLAKMKAEHEEYAQKFGEEDDEDKWRGLDITRGSWENDRAIAAHTFGNYGDYDTIKEALQAIKKNKDTLVDEYHGCMY